MWSKIIYSSLMIILTLGTRGFFFLVQSVEGRRNERKRQPDTAQEKPLAPEVDNSLKSQTFNYTLKRPVVRNSSNND